MDFFTSSAVSGGLISMIRVSAAGRSRLGRPALVGLAHHENALPSVLLPAVELLFSARFIQHRNRGLDVLSTQ